MAFTAWLFEAHVRAYPFDFVKDLLHIPQDELQMPGYWKDLVLRAWELTLSWDLIVDHVRCPS